MNNLRKIVLDEAYLYSYIDEVCAFFRNRN